MEKRTGMKDPEEKPPLYSDSPEDLFVQRDQWFRMSIPLSGMPVEEASELLDRVNAAGDHYRSFRRDLTERRDEYLGLIGAEGVLNSRKILRDLAQILDKKRETLQYVLLREKGK